MDDADRVLRDVRAKCAEFPVGAHRAAEVDLEVHNALSSRARHNPLDRAPHVVCNSPYHACAVEFAAWAKGQLLILCDLLEKKS